MGDRTVTPQETGCLNSPLPLQQSAGTTLVGTGVSVQLSADLEAFRRIPHCLIGAGNSPCHGSQNDTVCNTALS